MKCFKMDSVFWHVKYGVLVIWVWDVEISKHIFKNYKKILTFILILAIHNSKDHLEKGKIDQNLKKWLILLKIENLELVNLKIFIQNYMCKIMIWTCSSGLSSFLKASFSLFWILSCTLSIKKQINNQSILEIKLYSK